MKHTREARKGGRAAFEYLTEATLTLNFQTKKNRPASCKVHPKRGHFFDSIC